MPAHEGLDKRRSGPILARASGGAQAPRAPHSEVDASDYTLRRSRSYSNTIGNTEISTMMISTSSRLVWMNGRLPMK